MSDARKIYMLPTVDVALTESRNSIYQIVLRLQKHLPAFGYELTADENEAALVVGHAGQTGNHRPTQVAHIHGMYPTALYSQDPRWWHANISVIENIRGALAVTVPSAWVGEIFQRDMGFTPDIVPWGIEADEWYPQTANQQYVLWNKTRPDAVCNPKPVNELAKRVPDMTFVSTFAADAPTPNVQTIGTLPFADMQKYIRAAHLYLATTKETFGIGTLEAMASGVPVVGFNWGGTSTLVQHGVNGFLVEPFDYDGLAKGIAWASQHRAVLSANARKAAIAYTWRQTAQAFAAIYDRVLAPRSSTRVSVIIPCKNYERYLPDAINSVLQNRTSFGFEVIVVDDGSTDNSVEVAHNCLRDSGIPYQVITLTNGGVARARNIGASAASGDFLCFLDSDDMLGDPRYLQTLADALDANPTLGIVFTGLRVMDENGVPREEVNAFPSGYSFELQVMKRNQVPTCNMLRKEAFTRAGGYRPELWAGEDANLWLRIGAQGWRAQQVTTEGWFLYRIHDSSLSAAMRRGEALEPIWNDLTWVKDFQRPFAADGEPPRGSWAVREYDMPRISFIIPVGSKHRSLVYRALDSIDNQSYRYWEAIVINDSGKPLDLMGYAWARVIDTAGGLGPAAARNLGVKHARGMLLAFLDADDTIDPEWIKKTVTVFNKTGKYIYTDWINIHEDNTRHENRALEYDAAAIIEKTHVPHPITVLMRKADFESVGGFDETFTAWEDTEFFMRCAIKGVCGQRLPEALMIYDLRTGTQRATGVQNSDILLNRLYAMYRGIPKEQNMCACGAIPKGFVPEGATDSALEGMMRIEYAGGVAGHDVIGMQTGTYYGYRKSGDVFFVDVRDAYGNDRFIPMPDRVEATITPTVMPDAPELA